MTRTLAMTPEPKPVFILLLTISGLLAGLAAALVLSPDSLVVFWEPSRAWFAHAYGPEQAHLWHLEMQALTGLLGGLVVALSLCLSRRLGFRLLSSVALSALSYWGLRRLATVLFEPTFTGFFLFYTPPEPLSLLLVASPVLVALHALALRERHALQAGLLFYALVAVLLSCLVACVSLSLTLSVPLAAALIALIHYLGLAASLAWDRTMRRKGDSALESPAP